MERWEAYMYISPTGPILIGIGSLERTQPEDEPRQVNQQPQSDEGVQHAWVLSTVVDQFGLVHYPCAAL